MLRKRSKIKVIVMSATLETEKFKKFFEHKNVKVGDI